MTRMRRGITPVIAVLLLLMMTVAAAGGAYVWMQNLQDQIQERSEQQLRRQTETSIMMVSLQCHNEAGNYTVEALLKNGGSTKLDLDPVDVNVRESDTGELNLTLSRSALSLAAGETSDGVSITTGSQDMAEPGQRANYKVWAPGGSDIFSPNSYYTVNFVFTDVESTVVSGECQASASP